MRNPNQVARRPRLDTLRRSRRLARLPVLEFADIYAEKPRRKRTPRQHLATLWRPQTQSKFLDLPAELRNRIYRLALVASDQERIKLRNLEQPPLTATCRQIQSEALSIFLAENKFALDLEHIRVPYQRSHYGFPPQITVSNQFISKSTPAWMREAGNCGAHMMEIRISEINVTAKVSSTGGGGVRLQAEPYAARLNGTRFDSVQAYLDHGFRVRRKTLSGCDTLGLHVDDVLDLANRLLANKGHSSVLWNSHDNWRVGPLRVVNATA